MARYVRINLGVLALGVMLGVVLAIGLGVAAVRMNRSHVFSHGDTPPCRLDVRVVDHAGAPVPGVALVILRNPYSKEFCPESGNWRGRGSLVTDGNGEVRLATEGGYSSSPNWYLWGYCAGAWTEPTLALQYQGETFMTFPLIYQVDGSMEVICPAELLMCAGS